MTDTPKEEFIADVNPEETTGGVQSTLEGNVRISEDVIAQLAIRALNGIEGVVPASPGLMDKLRLGRQTTGGVRISVSETTPPEITVDAYVSVKYGLRIPDVCWDVQAAVKDQIERYTGYAIKCVNVYVQGITFLDKNTADAGADAVEETEDA